ncbi:MAG: hypothetical protein F4X65_02385 [Chloroflexi bacterium]|nr:hypothetical protein [Chloroflexota bacterium]
MFIKVEPAGFFMYTVQLIFDPASPDSEDQEVRDYLADHELEPRYQYQIEEDGRPCDVLQFGGCYLGRHLQSVGQIQRHAVEVELLTAEVEGHLAALALPQLAAPNSEDGEVRQETVAALVSELHDESAFQPDENGELAVVLDREEVKAAALRVLGKGS